MTLNAAEKLSKPKPKAKSTPKQESKPEIAWQDVDPPEEDADLVAFKTFWQRCSIGGQAAIRNWLETTNPVERQN